MKNQVSSGMRKWVMSVFLCQGQTTVESFIQFGTPHGGTHWGLCRGQQIGWSRSLRWCPIKDYWRKKRLLGQRRLRDAVANIFKNVKSITYRDRLVLLFLCCMQNQWVEVTGETLWINVKKTVLRVRADLIWKQLTSKTTFIIRGLCQRADLRCRRRELVW